MSAGVVGVGEWTYRLRTSISRTGLEAILYWIGGSLELRFVRKVSCAILWD
jgi:hypothetical protein